MPKTSQPGEIKNLEKFLGGVVRNLIRSYDKNGFKIEAHGYIDTDFRAELMQEGYLAYYQLLKVNPKMATNPRYAKKCIMNHLLQKVFKVKDKRAVTDNVVDEINLTGKNGHDDEIYRADELASRNPLTSIDASIDLETLSRAVDLSDAERLVLEYIHGYGRVEQALSIAKTALAMDRDREWVRSRYRAARIKLSVAASHL